MKYIFTLENNLACREAENSLHGNKDLEAEAIA